jgi:hypothetical protein
MMPIQTLFATHKFVHTDQGCIGRDALPFAHDTLRVDDFARQHGACVHGELQNMNGFFAAIHFHVRASRHIKSTALRFLRRSVIEQTPERANRARSFDASVIDVDGASVGGRYLLPFGLCSKRRQCDGDSNKCFRLFQKFSKFALADLRLQGGIYESHAPYYKVVHSS